MVSEGSVVKMVCHVVIFEVDVVKKSHHVVKMKPHVVIVKFWNLEMKEVVGVTVSFTLVVSVAVAIFGSIFAENILEWMGTPGNILDEGAGNASILFFLAQSAYSRFV